MNRNAKPRDIKYGPILCPLCLPEYRAQPTWFDDSTLCFTCPSHGPVVQSTS